MNKSAPLVDAYLHKGLREKLVIQLRGRRNKTQHNQEEMVSVLVFQLQNHGVLTLQQITLLYGVRQLV